MSDFLDKTDEVSEEEEKKQDFLENVLSKNESKQEEKKPKEKKEFPKQEPDSVPWEKIQFSTIDPNEFADLMRQKGILTYQDSIRRKPEILGVLQKLYGVNTATIAAFARDHELNP